jgi:hypothetical protein
LDKVVFQAPSLRFRQRDNHPSSKFPQAALSQPEAEARVLVGPRALAQQLEEHRRLLAVVDHLRHLRPQLELALPLTEERHLLATRLVARSTRLVVVVVVPRKTAKMHPREFQETVVLVSSLEFLEEISSMVSVAKVESEQTQAPLLQPSRQVE